MTVQRGSDPELRTHRCKVLSFDGKGAYVELPSFPVLTDAITVEVWMRASGNLARKSSLLTAAVGSHRVVNIHIPWASRVYWDSGPTSGYDRVEAAIGERPLLGVWTHWAFVKDVGRGWMGIYADGELVVEGEGRTRGFDAADHAVLGCYLDRKYMWAGALSELRIWRVARSPAQLRAAMFQRATGQEIGLVGHWPLDEGEGDRVLDRTSYSNDGVIHGAAWIDAELQFATSQATAATGLDDYTYWYKWSRMRERKGKPDDGKPYRRGRIWS